MLYALAIRLIVHEAAEIEPSTGRFVHAVFLDLIRQIDPALSEDLHRASGNKPFTVSPLLLEHVPRPISGIVRPGQCVRLRVTLLEDQVFAALLRYFRTSPTPRIRVGRVCLSVVDVTTESGAWTGAIALEDLSERATKDRSITLQFATPTSFSFGHGPAGSRLELFPRAALVFGGLARRWRAIGAPALDPALDTLLSEGLVEAAFNLRTQALRIAQRPELGAIGQCRFEARGEWNDRTLRQWNALADFAFFAGVGRKTTMGMGQARRLTTLHPEPEPEPELEGNL